MNIKNKILPFICRFVDVMGLKTKKTQLYSNQMGH